MATPQERLAAWEKHTPPKECTNCGNRTFTNVQDTKTQWSGNCSKCGLEHVAGYPASVKSRKPAAKGKDKGDDNGGS